MKKSFLPIIILFIATLCSSSRLSAQLEDGSIAPDWTLTDINGTQWNLYTLLNQNKTVFLDFSAVWCGPCWSYHTSGNLEALYEEYGPDGTDEVMVFMIEADGFSTMDELYGISGVTQGDWVTGTPYPIVLTHIGEDSYGAVVDYNIGYFPTIYRVCPDRIIKEVGQAATATLYSGIVNCDFATMNNDPSILWYTGDENTCSTIDLTIDIQNMGLEPLTACTIKAFDDGVEVLSYDWTGNLSTFGIEEVNIGSYTPVEPNTDLDIEITSADDDVSNNSVNTLISYEDGVTQTIHLEFKTDNYPTQLRWEIRDEDDEVIFNDGPYASGDKNEVVFDEDITFATFGCYKFICYDTGGEGLASPGYFEIRNSDGDFIADNTPNFGSKQTVALKAEDQTAIENSLAIDNLMIYPNPVQSAFNVYLDLSQATDINLTVVDLLGNSVMTIANEHATAGVHQYQVNASTLASGIYFVKVNSGDVNNSVKFTVAH